MPRKTKFKIALGNKIKNLRQRNNMTQEELGNILNVKKAAVANYESGYSEPDSEKIMQLASLFNVSTDYLLGNTHVELPVQTLSNNLAKIKLSEQELNNVFKYILEYYTSDNSILSPIADKLNAKEKEAFTEFSCIASEYFANKLDLELGDDFEIFAVHSDEELKKLKIIKEYMKDKITTIISTLNTEDIISGKYKNLKKFNENTISTIQLHELDTEIFEYIINDDSMAPLFNVGDIAIIQRTDKLISGKTYLIKYKNTYIIRRIIDLENELELNAMNPYYPPIRTLEIAITIIGQVIRAENQSAF